MINSPTTDPTGRHIMFFDGVCNYCKDVVEASMASDPERHFLFSPLQSEFAQKALGRYGIDSTALRSMYVISDYGTSDEAVRAAAPASNFLLQRLTGELKEAGAINSAKPRAVQDAEYQDVADHRYERWGKMEKVHLPEDAATLARYVI